MKWNVSVYMTAGFHVFKRWYHIALFSTILYTDTSSSVRCYCKYYSSTGQL